MPYGIHYDKSRNVKKVQQHGKSKAKTRDYSDNTFIDEKITKDYFDLMFECSQNQIIFGGNYYADILLPTKSWVVWDKRQYDKKDRNAFGDCELAWASTGVARCFNYLYNGMLQGSKDKDVRFHITQKPTQLWVQLLNFYTQPNDLILDPFAGSQSLHIACLKTGRRFIGFEIDKNYYDKGCAWVKSFKSQTSMFD